MEDGCEGGAEESDEGEADGGGGGGAVPCQRGGGDRAGGELAASRGLAAYARDGRTIHVRKPSSRDTDWNDELTSWLRRKAAR